MTSPRSLQFIVRYTFATHLIAAINSRATFLLLAVLMTGLKTASTQSKLTDSLQQIVSLHRGDSTEIKAILGLVEELSRKDIIKSKLLLKQAQSVATALHDPLCLSRVYHWMVVMNQNTGQMDSAAYYLNKFELLSKANANYGKVRANYVMAAGLFYKNQGRNKEALPFLLESVQLSKKYSDKTSQAGQLLNMGNLYTAMTNTKIAVNYHLQALRLFEEVGNRRGQSFALQSLGNDYSNLDQNYSAQRYFERSLKMKQELNDRRGLINAHIGLGQTYREKKDFKKSASHLAEGLKTAKEMKLVLEEARLEYAFGLLYRDTQQKDLSIEALKRGLVLAKQAGDSALSAELRSGILLSQLNVKKEAEEEQLLKGTIIASENSGNRLSIAAGYFNLAGYYADRHQYEKAYEYSTKYSQLNDSIKSDEEVLQIREMESRYESEKKEREIALLKKEQQLNEAELKIQKDRQWLIGVALLSVIAISALLVNRYRIVNKTRRLLEMEKMRTTIAQDLHDDIGSTLSSINIISQLALQQSDKGSETHFQRINEQSSKMMESISDIVWSINPNNDSLEQMVVKMKEFASEILEPKEIKYAFDGEETLLAVQIDLSKRKNLFLIFKETINNAAKYSKAKNVNIHFEKSGSALQVKISDDGVGFDTLAIKNGNGQRNLKERAAAVGGTLTVQSDSGKGTIITFSLPLP